MVLKTGDKVLVVQRRLFEQDEPRYFVGVVDAYDAGVAAVTGRTWVRDPFSAVMEPKNDERTKIISFAAGTVLTYLLPASTVLSGIRFDQDPSSLAVTLTDDRSLSMDLTEHLAPRRDH